MEVCFPFAKSLDTLGFFAHTPADMLALWELLGYPVGRTEILRWERPIRPGFWCNSPDFSAMTVAKSRTMI